MESEFPLAQPQRQGFPCTCGVAQSFPLEIMVGLAPPTHTRTSSGHISGHTFVVVTSKVGWCYWHPVSEARDAAKQLIIQRIGPHNKELTALNIDCVFVEKPYCKE